MLYNKRQIIEPAKFAYSPLMNDLIGAKLKEIIKLEDIIKKYDLNCKLKRGKSYNFGKYSLLNIFMRDT